MMNNNFFINLHQISVMLAGEMLHVAQTFIDKNYHPTVAQARDGRTKHAMDGWKNVNVCLSSEEVKGVLVYFFPILEIVRDYKHINL
jgi:uncharacterized protein involved in tellurium resistance